MSLQHLAIIPDGNRRWARGRGLPTLEGHRVGYTKVKHIGEWCIARGITNFTIWGFSTENWKRTVDEVGYLMDLIFRALAHEIDFYNDKGIRLKVMGRRENFSDKIRQAIEEAEVKTASNTRGQLNLCIDYGGRAEILAAAQKLMAEGVKPEEVTEERFTAATWFGDIPKPDLIIRTSGEQRLSGFLSWSGGYSELLFLDKYFPDFEESDLDAAIAEFQDRERRFGK
jgi:undecaprenyl diphosphate synthase